MSDVYDENFPCLVIYLVDLPVIACSDSPFLAASQLAAPRWPRIVGQGEHAGYDPLSVLVLYTIELSLSLAPVETR